MNSLKDYSYPRFSYIANLKPRPEVLLTHTIYWTEKRDGSCLGVSIDDDGNWMIRSRNREHADGKLTAAFLASGVTDEVRELIYHLREWHVDPIIYGEIMQPGKSPARFEVHTEPEFVVFDIYDAVHNTFLTYPRVYSKCFQNNAPVVELYGHSIHSDMNTLYDYRDDMLDAAKANSREGIVGKVWDFTGRLSKLGYSDGHLFFKEKRDAIKIPKNINNGVPLKNPTLPPLPESEILSAINEVREILGDDFTDIKVAMPAIARALNDESVKHCCAPVANMIVYYKQVLEVIV